jgi:hypothetical protein
LLSEADARFAVETCLWVLFDVDDDLVDDEDLVRGERVDHGPENGNGGDENSDVDLQHAEDIHNRRVVGHVWDGDGTGAGDAERYRSAD